ncbi:SMI1/KNR4 family protein [Priestia megaterium]|nr:SMI1/KNR4 family protein [Priestia megaterium]
MFIFLLIVRGKQMIEQTLIDLKRRLNENNEMLIEESDGSTCLRSFVFAPPASEQELIDFTVRTRNILPEDYQQFLLLHNGAQLFKGQYENIVDLSKIEDIPNDQRNFNKAFGSYLTGDRKDSYPIGHFIDIGSIMISNTRCREGKRDYLWIASIEHIEFPYDFQTWLHKLIAADGHSFWT